MKRFISFIIAIILILSIANCSFAIDKTDFIGIWYGKNEVFGYTITFGIMNGNKVAIMSMLGLNSQAMNEYHFYTTLDKETGEIYLLSPDENEIGYKLKLNGDKLELHNMNGETNVVLDKLTN